MTRARAASQRGLDGWLGLHHGEPFRGSMYVGVTSNLIARVAMHRAGRGSTYVAERALDRLVWAEFTERIEDAIAQQKRLKPWRREWKLALIERGDPDWQDLFDQFCG